MIKPRKLNSSMPFQEKPNVSRDGSAKITPVPETVKGQVRQTKGDLHPWLHGQAVDDEPNSAIIKSHERPIGYSHGVSDAQIIKNVNHPTSGQVLHSAARLGRGEKA